MIELTNLQHKTIKEHVELGRSKFKRDNADFKKRNYSLKFTTHSALKNLI